jgi:Flp pilus assembly protein TadG
MSKITDRCLKLLKDCRGTAFVEFGLLAPVFFLVTVGIVDFGRMVWLSNTVEHAATEGTRYAAVRGSNKATVATTQTITDFVKGQAELIPPSDMNIVVSWTPTDNNNPGSTVTVQVTYNFEYLLVGFLGFDPVDLEGTSTMVIN